MLRIGAVARNIREFNRGHLLDKFPEIVGRLRSTLERFMEVPSCIDRGFIGDEMLECIPSPARVARSIVGGIDRQTAPAARRTGSHRPVGLAQRLCCRRAGGSGSRARQSKPIRPWSPPRGAHRVASFHAVNGSLTALSRILNDRMP